MWRSTDGGASWTAAWDYGAWPTRDLRYSIDISAAPWLTWNATPALPETEAFADLDEDVRQSLRRILDDPFIPVKGSVRGFVYEVETGRLREVK